MDCLKDYIGLKNCGDEDPESGLFINSLPGISFELINKITIADQVTFAQTWSDIQDEAAVMFESDFVAEVNKCFEISAYCNYSDFICNNKATITKAWRYCLGVVTMQFLLYSTRLNSFTVINRDEAKELMAHYQLEYEAAMSTAVKVINFSSCCMSCGGAVQTVGWLP